MSTPAVEINLAGIKENVMIMKEMCQERGIELTGVVKGAAGDLQVVKSLLAAGVDSIGDSRLENIIAFREAGIESEMLLLRLPRISEAEKVVKYANISLVSEIETVQALSRAADKQDLTHRVILMVDVGDLREGVLPGDLKSIFREISQLAAIDVIGLGTNVGCYGGVLPDRENTEILVELKWELETEFGVRLPVISGGNTATTVLFADNSLPSGINHLRIGEAILQGTDITHQRKIEYLNQDNFRLRAEIIELKEKPSVPRGEIGHDAFGNKPEYQDRGIRRRAILALGRQDIRIKGLKPRLAGADIIGASSDHLLVDITETEETFKIGDTMEFNLSYGAMLAAMTSSYTHKKYHDSRNQ